MDRIFASQNSMHIYEAVNLKRTGSSKPNMAGERSSCWIPDPRVYRKKRSMVGMESETEMKMAFEKLPSRVNKPALSFIYKSDT